MRQSGRTTRAMLTAPKGSYYIVAYQNNVEFTKRIARKLGRGDLKIVAASWITNRKWIGLRDLKVVEDHHIDDIPYRKAFYEGLREITSLMYREMVGRSIRQYEWNNRPLITRLIDYIRRVTK